MKRTLFLILTLWLALSTGLFGAGTAEAKGKKPFNPNDFSTYGLGLKDAPLPKNMKPYTPKKRYVTKEEFKKGKISPQQLLPQKVDLRPYFSPIRNQSKFGTCVAFAATGLREYYIGKYTDAKGSDITYLSPLYVYYPSGPDDGMTFYSAFDIMLRKGIPPETERPYDPNRSNTEQFYAPITELQRKNAAPYKINNFRYINRYRMIDDIKQAVANGDPVMVGIEVYPNFDSTPPTGIVPPVGEKKSRGGHALVVVGYDEENQWFIMRNSWGERFGDKGYAYMRYDILEKMTRAYGYVADVGQKSYPPQGVKLSVSSVDTDSVTLSVSALQANSFDLYRDNQFIKSFNGMNVTEIELSPDHAYNYHIVAKNANGETRSMNVSVRTATATMKKAS